MDNNLSSSFQTFMSHPMNKDLTFIPGITPSIADELKAKKITAQNLLGRYLASESTKSFVDFLNSFPAIKRENTANIIKRAMSYKTRQIFGYKSII